MFENVVPVEAVPEFVSVAEKVVTEPTVAVVGTLAEAIRSGSVAGAAETVTVIVSVGVPPAPVHVRV